MLPAPKAAVGEAYRIKNTRKIEMGQVRERAMILNELQYEHVV